MQALKDVSVTLKGGKWTVLMGPPGSGKTTLLSILGCMLTPTEGTVRVCCTSTSGRVRKSFAKIRRQHIGFVFQSYHLFSTLTAAENVRLAPDVRHERGPKAIAKTRSVGPRWPNVENGIFPRPTQRRRATAGRNCESHRRRAFGHPRRRADCRVDAANGQAIMAIFSAIARERGHAVLVVTHDPRPFGFADRIAYIEDGLLTREEFADPAVAALSEPERIMRASHRSGLYGR